MKIDLDNASGGYGIIYTDPAWQQTKGGKRDCRPKQGKELDYKTLMLRPIFLASYFLWLIVADLPHIMTLV